MKQISKKLFLFCIGCLALVLGVVGIFLPLLPTTPFILLASWCFARSSQRFHHWLLNHRLLGPIIHRWEAGEGISPAHRNKGLIVLWSTLVISMLIVGKWWAPLVLGCCGMIGTYYMIKWSRLENPKAANISSSAGVRPADG